MRFNFDQPMARRVGWCAQGCWVLAAFLLLADEMQWVGPWVRPLVGIVVVAFVVSIVALAIVSYRK